MFRKIRCSVEEALELGPGNSGRRKFRVEEYEALQEGGKPFTHPDPDIKERRSWLVLARAFNDKGSREFVCGPFHEVVASYVQDSNRTYEEVLYKHQPARLFIEFRVTNDEYVSESTAVIKRVRKYVNDCRVNEAKVDLREFTRPHGDHWIDVRAVFDVWCFDYGVVKYVLDQALLGYQGPAIVRTIDSNVYFVDMPFSARPGFQPWVPAFLLDPVDMVQECAAFLVSGLVPSGKGWHFNPMPMKPFPAEFMEFAHEQQYPDPRKQSPLLEEYDLARELGFPVTETANVFTYFLYVSHDPRDPEDTRVVRSDKAHAFVAVVWNKGPGTKHESRVLPVGAFVYPVHKQKTGGWRLTYLDRTKDEVHDVEFPACSREFRVVHVIEREHKRMREE